MYFSRPELEGLPIAVKDEMDIEGQPMTSGSLYLKDNVSTETHYAGQRLLDAGCIVHARTTTPEFSCSGTADSRIHGTTRTPWRPDLPSTARAARLHDRGCIDA